MPECGFCNTSSKRQCHVSYINCMQITEGGTFREFLPEALSSPNENVGGIPRATPRPAPLPMLPPQTTPPHIPIAAVASKRLLPTPPPPVPTFLSPSFPCPCSCPCSCSCSCSDFVAPFWPAPPAPKSALTPSCCGGPILVLCRAPPSSPSRQRLNLFKIWAASEVVSAALQDPQGRLLAPLALKTRWHHPQTCPAPRHRVRPYRLRQICRFYSRGIHTAHAKDSNLSVVWARSPRASRRDRAAREHARVAREQQKRGKEKPLMSKTRRSRSVRNTFSGTWSSCI